MRKNCLGSHGWKSQILIDGNGVMLSAAKDRISLEYELIIKLVTQGTQPGTQGSLPGNLGAEGPSSILIHLPVLLLADYTDNGLLSHVEEQFDVLDLIRQRELCKDAPATAGRLAATAPRPSTITPPVGVGNGETALMNSL